MRDEQPTPVQYLLLSASLLGLPLLGVFLSGKPIAPLLEFPPRTPTILHAPFSWPVFGFFSVIELGVMAGLLFLLFGGSRSSTGAIPTPPPIRFPWWGWVSVCSLFLFWILAWTRFTWFADFQGLTFTPLWISFIIFLNALTYQRTGHCLLLDQPKFFLSLFVWSAGFWWYFEYLNRFVQNWRYIGIEPMTGLFYGVHSSLAFSTVLPAILSTCELLSSCSLFTKYSYRRPLLLSQSTSLIPSLMFPGVFCLMGLALWPNYFFSLLWVGPLLLMVAFQLRWGGSRIISALRRGAWQVITIPACAALLCGFCWELWNYESAAKWVYSIPFVDRFHLFEMPILGYGGYLPFGLECVVAIDFFTKGRHRLVFMGESNTPG